MGVWIEPVEGQGGGMGGVTEGADSQTRTGQTQTQTGTEIDREGGARTDGVSD